MKRTIIIIILAFVCIIGQAREKTIVWEKPAIAFNRADYLVIQKVELTKQQTRVFLVVTNTRQESGTVCPKIFTCNLGANNIPSSAQTA